jgi:hypothetical protein
LNLVDQGLLERSVSVVGLPLTNKTVAYYYLDYGTVLAFLSRPTKNYCDEAIQVLEEVRRTYPDDPTIVSIADDSEGICRRLSSGEILPAVTSEPEMLEGTPTPGG